MREDADDETVARHLEAYLLWLFGWVMFCSTQGNSVRANMIPYARAIADAPLEEVPQFSWASAVLAATYHGLCDGCTKTADREPILTGCPLLLQVWSYERFPVGRPFMDTEPYGHAWYHDNDVDRPTMGTIWCRRRVCSYAHVIVAL